MLSKSCSKAPCLWEGWKPPDPPMPHIPHKEIQHIHNNLWPAQELLRVVAYFLILTLSFHSVVSPWDRPSSQCWLTMDSELLFLSWFAHPAFNSLFETHSLGSCILIAKKICELKARAMNIWYNYLLWGDHILWQGKVPLHPHILIIFQIQKSEIEMKVRSLVSFLPFLTSCWPTEGRLRPSLDIFGGVWDHHREDLVPWDEVSGKSCPHHKKQM